ncbi:transglycosylase SLT domain-containing protein [[Mycobacterium] wendilense]|uniref:Transglycosylase SLT domain-containing protein n=1 Tax=[Mycobacterium] wendilense TaxID=3064284 RepID=A0ABM9MG87_9MYCO|nr:transglycosylase SLT domain-containing protein [Mycolicibacterium sp. MU0050]CAJ1584445.1 transglycosylase SLT domain-containing protein [Mycolicibacterium sp. MU0050]
MSKPEADPGMPAAKAASVRRASSALLVALALTGCASQPEPEPAPTPSVSVPVPAPPTPSRDLASDPARLADDLVHDERVLRDPSSPEAMLAAAAHRQQAAYRVLGRHPEWDPVVRPRIPPELLDNYDRNITARRDLTALGESSGLRDTVPAWRIVAPAPAEELLGYFREAEAASGVPWAHLAAINLIETGFGRIEGTSTAGAQGPMQFMPGTWEQYGAGGDIRSPRDSILAAGRFLAAQGFAVDRDNALFRYNNSDRYVRAVNAYAAVMATEPTAFHAYHRWDVYYVTTAGDVLLPIGYAETAPVPVAEYRAREAQPAPTTAGR